MFYQINYPLGNSYQTMYNFKMTIQYRCCVQWVKPVGTPAFYVAVMVRVPDIPRPVQLPANVLEKAVGDEQVLRLLISTRVLGF